MQGYPYLPPPPPQPPQKSGLSPAVIAILAIVGVVAVLIGIPLVLGVVIGIRRVMAEAHDGGVADVDPLTVPLAQSYTTGNKLLTARYPSSFAVKTLDDSTLLVSRNFTDGSDEGLTLAAVQDPITNDPREFARLLLDLTNKNVSAKGGTFVKTSERPAQCLGKYAGVEVESTFSLHPDRPYLTKACFFIHNNRGYELRYDLPRDRSAVEVPLCERIMAATEIAP